MSKNRNRAKLNKAMTSMEYTRIMKNDTVYCRVCVKRGGGYNFSCAPSSYNKKGWRGRMYMSWKNNRKTQWKRKK